MYSLDNLSYIDLKPYSIQESTVSTALKSRSCFKLTIDGSYQSLDSIEQYSQVFAMAGAHIISSPANVQVVQAVKQGIQKANIDSESEPQIMVSFSLDQEYDPRTKRQALNDLLASDSTNISNNTDGIHFSNVSLTTELLASLWSNGATFLEIYVGSNFYWLESYIRKIKELSPHPWMISVVLSGQTASYNEIQEQVSLVHDMLGDGALIQIDGTVDSTEQYSQQTEDISMLRSLASASALMAVDKPVYVQISGGMNDTIKPLLSRFGLKVNGVSMDNYPRKVIEPHINDTDTAVAIANKLVQSIKH